MISGHVVNGIAYVSLSGMLINFIVLGFRLFCSHALGESDYRNMVWQHHLIWSIFMSAQIIGDLLGTWWQDAAYATGVLIFCTWLFFRKDKRRRRKAIKLVGDKSKAIIAAMKRKMRERPPRRVLQPIPQGV